jgi:hypothetical protein
VRSMNIDSSVAGLLIACGLFLLGIYLSAKVWKTRRQMRYRHWRTGCPNRLKFRADRKGDLRLQWQRRRKWIAR